MLLQDILNAQLLLVDSPHFIKIRNLHSEIDKFCYGNFVEGTYYIEFPAVASRIVYFKNEEDLNYFKLCFNCILSVDQMSPLQMMEIYRMNKFYATYRT